VDASSRVTLSIEEGLARLTLARAEARNAIDPPMVQGLAEAVGRCGDVRALLLTAEGSTFSVGGDLRYLSERSHRLAEELDPMIALYHRTLAQIAELPAPVVCAACGGAAGGALGLLWCADVTIVAHDAKLASGFTALGLSGDGGSSWWLPRLIGLSRARELLLSGRVLSGTEAADWGLVTRAVPSDRVKQEAERVARALAELPAAGYAETRALLARSSERDLHEGLAAEHAAMLRTAATADARERVAEFVRPAPPGRSRGRRSRSRA
jgi:2-(1,2-epoxy-1,2-dihydrophenyl)acetyl-CoA isomerase